ncbi:Fe-S cluster biogenesis protein NfuA [Albidovulum inexpectatum]|uniref:Fe-S cluster biogenesis protein NfuA n=1 Tax=Albidovulum inexpectatum TaxID=196587 RepID=A0A2S5JES1_9RHOB|nr:DUF6522 family protein [Albidovulum inexpectatum]PPB79974.1 Fe-S cluster biogenesis protein NfuA [Albidovulum inexpectatum]
MSDAPGQMRIRARSSMTDPHAMGFMLDQPLPAGVANRFNSPEEAAMAPLARALFGVEGIERIAIDGATIWLRKAPTADWASLKHQVAATIRKVMAETASPLGTAQARNDDAALLRAVEEILHRQVNPAIAAHGGQIDVVRVEQGRVFLRMSGGCQGCAASAATLREGVERMLRAARPDIREIVDVTEHELGANPYYSRTPGEPPVLNRPLPPGTVTLEDGRIAVDPDYLAPRLGLTPDAMRAAMKNGEVVGVTEIGEGKDAGKRRVVVRSQTRAWAAEILPDGSAREVPPPRAARSGTRA